MIKMSFFSAMTIVLCSVGGWGCGGKEDTNGASGKPLSSTSAIASAASGASTISSAVNLSAAPIPEKTVPAAWTPDEKRWIKAYKIGLPSGAVTGQTWADARKVCLAAGRDLCTEDQFMIACDKDASLATTPTWTISAGSGTTWVVRGGGGCASTAEAPENETAPGRIGLCCERGITIAPVANRRAEAWLKTADVYAHMVEDALNSSNVDAITKLLADKTKLFATNRAKNTASKALSEDRQKYTEMYYRFSNCDTAVDTEKGTFECDTVMTRTPKSSGKRELSVFRLKFEYAPPHLGYTVFAEPGTIRRAWGTY